MSFQDFLYGFMQGFDQAGGTQRLSSWAARNIAGGEYYDPTSDPLFYQDLERARALGTPEAQESFLGKYGQFFELPEGQTPEQYFFGIEPEAPTFYGMPEDVSRSLLFNTAVQGRPIPENIISEYADTFGYDIRPMLEMLQPSDEPGYEEFMKAYMLASEVGTPAAQQMFMQEYGSRIPEGVTQEQLFPRHRYSDIDLILSGFRKLPEEQVGLLERLGYTVTPLSDYEGYYAIQEPLYTYTDTGAGLELDPFERMRQGFYYLTPEETKRYTEAGVNLVPVPGYEGWYRTGPEIPAAQTITDTGFDYNKLDMPTMVQYIMADRQVSPGEMAAWNASPWGIFGHPAEIWETLMKEQETQGMPAVQGRMYDEETYNLILTRGIGVTPQNDPVIQNQAGGRYAYIPESGGWVSWTGPVIKYDERGYVVEDPNGNRLIPNEQGLLAYPDGTVFVDQRGQSYYYDKNFGIVYPMDYQSQIDFGVEEIGTDRGPGLLQRLFSNFFGDSETNERAREVANQYRTRYPNATTQQIIMFLRSIDDQAFRERFGVEVEKVIEELSRG